MKEKLCNEIVEPALQMSPNISGSKTSSRLHHSPSRQDGKPTRSVTIEKKKVVNKITPRDSATGKTVVKQLKSTETFLRKDFTDIAVNTFITGPLRCDNDCVTMVRRRDNHCNCKSAHKRNNLKSCAKQIQTYDKNYFNTDKACAQCIETVSCGTQFLEKLSKLAPKDSKSCLKMNRELKSLNQKAVHKETRIRQKPSNPMNNFSKFVNVSSLGARRWALSQYPTRGPDF